MGAGQPRREREDAEGAERLCVATRAVRPVEDLLRFVVGPDGALVPDLKRKLPGRGVWVTATRAAVEQAVARKAFGRSLKTAVTVPASLPGDVEALLARWARDAVSLANKAGGVVSGFSKVEAAIARDALAAVLAATDGAPDGARKIAQALRRRFGEGAHAVPVVAALDSAEMSLALGRPHVIHAALLEGPASRAALARLRALERYRDRAPETAADAGHDHADDDVVADTTTRVPAGQGRND